MYGVRMFGSTEKSSHSPLQSEAPYAGWPAAMIPEPVASVMGFTPKFAYAGPGAKNAGYGRCPRNMSCDVESKNIPHPVRTTVLPLPKTSHATFARGPKFLYRGWYRCGKADVPTWTCEPVPVSVAASKLPTMKLLNRLFFSEITPKSSQRNP